MTMHLLHDACLVMAGLLIGYVIIPALIEYFAKAAVRKALRKLPRFRFRK